MRPHDVRHDQATLFQSTHPHGVRRSGTALFLCLRVSIHAPTWGATGHDASLSFFYAFQSTHPHGVRRSSIPRFVIPEFVSIHAPTWGATQYRQRNQPSRGFNPRTHMGCDWSFTDLSAVRLGFNPRTHMGCDLTKCRVINPTLFQSTHPHGVRPLRTSFVSSSAMFQSTHPHGVRPRYALRSSSALCFNPRTHMGCDLCEIENVFFHFVSIHAPTWGATFLIFLNCFHIISFNPRTHMGCDLPSIVDKIYRGFNPRTHMGCDLICVVLKHCSVCFNPRTHMGCDVVSFNHGINFSVSIHAPTWGATQREADFTREMWFQSTHPHGVRPSIYKTISLHQSFNPRTHMGCDLLTWHLPAAEQCFNPRTHMGCDWISC